MTTNAPNPRIIYTARNGKHLREDGTVLPATPLPPPAPPPPSKIRRYVNIEVTSSTVSKKKETLYSLFGTENKNEIINAINEWFE